jgi:uncharacterized protein (AIM24 family)
VLSRAGRRGANFPVMDLVECQWCRGQNQPGASSCVNCGAPLDARNLVSDSGWREAPHLHDLTEFRFSNSIVQVEGDLVPVADVALAGGDGVYFEQPVMLWKDDQTALVAMNAGGGIKRSLGGMPHVLSQANGPGRVAFSRDAPGQMVVLPMAPGVEVDLREHVFLLATHTVSYSFVRIKDLTSLLHGGGGMFMDRFVTQTAPGVLILHGNGNVFERLLRPGEKLLVEPGAFLYKDSSVQMTVVQQNVRTGLLRHGLYLAEMTGPGRVGIQSMYVHHHTE